MDTFFKGVRVLTVILEKLLVFLMWIMVFSVVWQVFTRFFTDSPSTFTVELARYLMIWVGVLGGAYVYALKRHLAIEILITKLAIKQQLFLLVFINILVITFSSIVLIYGGFIVVNTALQFNQISPSLALFGTHLPMGYVYLVAPISGALINIFAITDILQIVTTSTKNNNE